MPKKKTKETRVKEGSTQGRRKRIGNEIKVKL